MWPKKVTAMSINKSPYFFNIIFLYIIIETVNLYSGKIGSAPIIFHACHQYNLKIHHYDKQSLCPTRIVVLNQRHSPYCLCFSSSVSLHVSWNTIFSLASLISALVRLEQRIYEKTETAGRRNRKHVLANHNLKHSRVVINGIASSVEPILCIQQKVQDSSKCIESLDISIKLFPSISNAHASQDKGMLSKMSLSQTLLKACQIYTHPKCQNICHLLTLIFLMPMQYTITHYCGPYYLNLYEVSVTKKLFDYLKWFMITNQKNVIKSILLFCFILFYVQWWHGGGGGGGGICTLIPPTKLFFFSPEVKTPQKRGKMKPPPHDTPSEQQWHQ